MNDGLRGIKPERISKFLINSIMFHTNVSFIYDDFEDLLSKTKSILKDIQNIDLLVVENHIKSKDYEVLKDNFETEVKESDRTNTPLNWK